MSGLECRLGGRVGQTDFLVCLTAASAGEDSLLALVSGARNDTWSGLRAFAESWADRSSVLHGNADRVWLEFDLRSDVDERSPPSVFFCPRTPHASVPDWSVALTGLRLLQRTPISNSLANQVSACFAALPPGAFVFQVGAMLSRCDERIRLCVWGLAPEELAGYLRGLDWTGPMADLERMVTALSTCTRSLAVDFDVDSNGLGDLIGLECYCFAPGEPLRDVDWGPLLDLLDSSRLCTSAERRALARFGGHTPIEETADIKISNPVRGPAHAKAYLAFWHAWR
jgi:hypothetical protein